MSRAYNCIVIKLLKYEDSPKRRIRTTHNFSGRKDMDDNRFDPVQCTCIILAIL